jgi:hypothetical protein
MYRGAIGAFAVAALMVTTAAQAADDARYPNWR